MSNRWVAALSALCLAIAMTAPQASGVEIAPGGDDAAAALLAPVPAGPLKDFPWMRAGLRLSYREKIAVVQGARFGSVPDPRGLWYDPATGQRRSPVERNTGGAALSILQYTVGAVEPTALVRSETRYAFDPLRMQAPPAVTFSTGALVDPSANTPGEALFVPAPALATYLQTPAQNVAATRGEQKFLGHAFDAVTVEQRGQNYYNLAIYDLKTGLLLYKLTDSITAPQQQGFRGDNSRGDEHITILELWGTREVHSPWADEAPPAWVSTVRGLRYTGTIDHHLSTMAPQAIANDISVTSRGRSWLFVQNGTTAQTFSSVQFDGLWAGPASLAKLQQGQVLDVDPITSMKTFVGRIDNQTVVISQHNESKQVDFVYEKREGRLVRQHALNLATREELTVSLQGTR